MSNIWLFDISLDTYKNILICKNNKEKFLKLVQEHHLPYNNFYIVIKSSSGKDIYPLGKLTIAKYIHNNFNNELYDLNIKR